MEYVFRRETNCQGPTAGTFLRIFQRDPYRTQLVFNANSTGTAALAVDLVNSQDDVTNAHKVLSLFTQGGSTTLTGARNQITLSYPLHGPMVCEEWWCSVPAGATLDSTAWYYSD